MAVHLVRLKRIQAACLAVLFASIGAAFLMPDYVTIVVCVFAAALIGLVWTAGAIHRASPAEAAKPERRICTIVIIAIVCVLLDVFVFGPMLSVLMMLFAAVYYLPRTLVALKRPQVARLRFTKGLVVFGIGMATAWLFSIDAQQARERAKDVIAALDRYKAAHGAFPQRLEELVPTYLPEVPRARLLPAASRFYYGRMPDGGATLMYVVLPPFGRSVYDFDTRKWHELD